MSKNQPRILNYPNPFSETKKGRMPQLNYIIATITVEGESWSDKESPPTKRLSPPWSPTCGGGHGAGTAEGTTGGTAEGTEGGDFLSASRDSA